MDHDYYFLPCPGYWLYDEVNKKWSWEKDTDQVLGKVFIPEHAEGVVVTIHKRSNAKCLYYRTHFSYKAVLALVSNENYLPNYKSGAFTQEGGSSCSHTWEMYQGLFEQFNHCTKCGEAQ